MEIVRGIRFKKYLEEEAEKERNQLAESYEESKRNKKKTNYIRKTSREIKTIITLSNVRWLKINTINCSVQSDYDQINENKWK